jgi:hypothetical protein
VGVGREKKATAECTIDSIGEMDEQEKMRFSSSYATVKSINIHSSNSLCHCLYHHWLMNGSAGSERWVGEKDVL